jgi:hypothetical protein
MKTGLVAALVALLPVAAASQTGPLPAVGTDSVVVTPGKRYQGSGFHRFFFGSTYRDLWATPIKVPVLNLHRFAGGLRPLKRGGGNQTKSLRLAGADGREYVFRLVDKDKVSVPAGFDKTAVEGITRDQVSAHHPAAAEVAAPLLTAAGVLHVTPSLAVMPDDSLLGEFRGDFAGQLGMIELYPDKPGHAAGFAGAIDVIESVDLRSLLDKDAGAPIHARAYLAARLMDMLMGDWDRHPGQWKWARFDASPGATWEPLPRDRDKPFISHGGIIKLVGKVSPNVMTFRTSYPSIRGLTWNALEFDRRLLGGLEKPVWDSVAQALSRRITDAVIDSAVAWMPVEFRYTAPYLASVLKRRRDQLPLIADRFYRYLAPVLDIHATDADDQAIVTRREDGSVEVALRSGAGEPYFHRRFEPAETNEIRLYLHGGDDSAVVSGNAQRSIPVRIIGGNGTNRLIDSSRVGGRSRPTHFYDAGPTSGVGYGPDTVFNRRPWVESGGKPRPPAPDRGGRIAPGLGFGSDGDIGLVLHVGVTRVLYGFRRTPYSSKVGLTAAYATGVQGFRVGAVLDQRREESQLHFSARARMSELEVVNYHGLGNDTPDDPSGFYQVRQRQWLLFPALSLSIGSRGDISAGPLIQYSTTDSVPGRFISADRPYGFGGFGQAGLRLSLDYDGRDQPRDPHRGVLLDFGGSWYPAMWDVSSAFGVIAGNATTYLTMPIPAHPILVLHGGGKKLFGDFPYHESAFIGGRSAVRSLEPERYAGDAALFGTAELRMSLARFPFVLPFQLGVFGFADVGRVYVDGNSPGGWHSGTGVGLWVGVLNPGTSLSVEVGRGAGVTDVRFRTGMSF